MAVWLGSQTQRSFSFATTHRQTLKPSARRWRSPSWNQPTRNKLCRIMKTKIVRTSKNFHWRNYALHWNHISWSLVEQWPIFDFQGNVELAHSDSKRITEYQLKHLTVEATKTLSATTEIIAESGMSWNLSYKHILQWSHLHYCI